VHAVILVLTSAGGIAALVRVGWEHDAITAAAGEDVLATHSAARAGVPEVD
jgi:hypothetical protein